MLHIAVCDDNPLHLRHTVSILRQNAWNAAPAIRTYTDANALLEEINDEGYAPDIAVLDIELGEDSGIALAEKLNRLLPDCQIIFLSGYASHASEVYTTRHIWFVLKDRVDEFLLPAVRKAAETLAQRAPEDVLSVRHEGTNVLLPISDVLFVERIARKLRVVCRTQSYLTSQSPSALLRPAVAELFAQCHQGYWINLSHVSALDRNEFIMDNNVRIPISRTYRDAVRARFFDLYRL